jgi:hypothetical protein
MPTPNLPPWERVARFWDKIDCRGPDECWPWIAKANVHGYGADQICFGKKMLAHRAAWKLANGEFPPVPKGQRSWVVMHTCDNPPCCNPAHLQLGTYADNSRDMSDKGRWGVRDLRVGSAHGNAKLTEEQVAAIRQSALSNGELAEQYGVTKGTIEYARKYGWKHVKVRAKKHASGKSLATRGANNPVAKLTDDDVRAIRASTEKPGALAKRFGVVPDYVTMIRKRKVWKHVT